MNATKLGKIRNQLAALRRSPQGARALENLARKLGRKPVKRGKEPMWENTNFGLYPLAIPHHWGRDLSIGVKNSILDHFRD